VVYRAPCDVESRREQYAIRNSNPSTDADADADAKHIAGAWYVLYFFYSSLSFLSLYLLYSRYFLRSLYPSPPFLTIFIFRTLVATFDIRPGGDVP
jgi:hypothetical protein